MPMSKKVAALKIAVGQMRVAYDVAIERAEELIKAVRADEAFGQLNPATLAQLQRLQQSVSDYRNAEQRARRK